MVRFNKTQPPNRAPIQTQQLTTGRTGNNAPGFARDAKSELFLLAVSNFVGQDSAYEKAAARDDRFIRLIHAVAAADPDWMKRFLPWLRGEANMRTAALIGAVEAARAMVDHKIPGGRQLVDAVQQRGDEPGEVLGYLQSRGYKLPKPIKRGIADAAERLYTEYTLLKYDTPSHAYRFAAELKRLAGGDFFCGPAFNRIKPDCPPIEVIIKDVTFADAGIQQARNEKQKALELAAAQLARAQGEAAALKAEAKGKSDAAAELQKLYANPAWVKLQLAILQAQMAKDCGQNPNCHMIVGADGNIILQP